MLLGFARVEDRFKPSAGQCSVSSESHERSEVGGGIDVAFLGVGEVSGS